VSGVKPEPFGDRENNLPMGHPLADRVGKRVGCKNSPLLIATWAEAALPAGEGDEHLMVTNFATNSGKAEVEVTASEEFAYHLANDRSPMTVAILIMLSVNSLELRKMALDEFVEG
jgi:hypothetical protein